MTAPLKRVQEDVTIVSMDCVARDTYKVSFVSQEIASTASPGQFVNVKVGETTSPLLRRPFSISRIEGERIEILFQKIGLATNAMTCRRPGDTLNVIGPLGNAFHYDAPEDTAVLVAGGVGIAPMPFLTQFLSRRGKKIRTFLGARSGDYLVTAHLHNVVLATDDGSQGFHGTVIDLLRTEMDALKAGTVHMFACGPTPMLKALSAFVLETGISCEASLEGEMGCGIGLCQGCPVEMVNDEKKYRMVCHDGTIFPITSIRF